MMLAELEEQSVSDSDIAEAVPRAATHSNRYLKVGDDRFGSVLCVSATNLPSYSSTRSVTICSSAVQVPPVPT